jgi:hypothetical protein
MVAAGKAIITKRRKLGRAMLKNVHLMPKRGRSVFYCGATLGPFIRASDAWYLKKFLKEGGTLCPACSKLHGKEAT